MSVDFLIFVAVKDCDFTSSCGYKNRRSFLNVYIIERLVLSHIFYFNRYNSCLSPCIFVVFITCVIYNPHGQHLKLLLPYYFPCISFFYQTIHFSMFCVILVVDNLMIKSFIENMTCYLTKNLGVLLQI